VEFCFGLFSRAHDAISDEFAQPTTQPLVAAASVVCVDHFLYGCNAKTMTLSWRDASESEDISGFTNHQ
jgi:hypothetical protein